MSNNTRRSFLKGIGVTTGALCLGGNIVLAAETTNTETNGSPSGWTLYRGNNGRTGSTDASGPTKSENLSAKEWTNPDGNISEPVVVDETLYLAVQLGAGPAGTNGYVVAYDLKTSTEKWKRTGLPAPHTPTVGSDAVYVTTTAPDSPEPDEGGLFALDIETGEIKWARNDQIAYGGPTWTNPVVADGHLYTTNSPSAYELDPDTGETIWETEGADGSVLYTDGTIYTGNGTALNATNGTEKWTVEGSIKMVSDGVVYGIKDNTIHSWSTVDGNSQWSIPIDGEIRQCAIADEQLFYIAHGESSDSLIALDTTTGEQRWSSEPLSALSGLSVADGTVYVGGRQAVEDGEDEGRVLAIDPMSGESKWNLRLPSRTNYTDVHDGLSATTPIATDGMLLVSSTQHDLAPEWYESIGYTRYEILYRIEATETSDGDDSEDDDSDGDDSDKDESSEDGSDTGSEDSGEEEQQDDTEDDC